MSKSLSLVFAGLIGLFVSVSAMAATTTSTYTQAIKAGKYEASYQSIVPELNGQKCAAEVKQVAENVEATVTCANSKEVWTWNDKTLMQQEIDVKAGTVKGKYSATGTKAATTEQNFAINGDKAKNACDAGVDCRTNWTIRTTADGFEYVTFGPKDKKDPASPVVQRHLLQFKAAAN